jgi:hypothetical protein
MQKAYGCELATHIGPESCGAARKSSVEALTGERAGRVFTALAVFRFRVGWLWHRALSRCSQNGRVHWDRMRRLLNRWLPLPTVGHPYPLRRMGVIS